MAETHSLDEAPEPKRFKVDPESSESPPTSLETLHTDCLRVVFDLLTIKDLLQLRYVSRTLNNVISQFLRTSFRKMSIILDADRSQLEVDNQGGRGGMAIPGFGGVLNRLVIPRMGHRLPTQNDRAALRDQPHFRLKDFITMKTPMGTLHAKVASLALFLANNMPELEEFGLLIHHEKHLWSAASLLASLRKLKVLLIDKSEAVQTAWSHCSMTETMDAIAALPELESLYYFSSRASRESIEETSPGMRIYAHGSLLSGLGVPGVPGDNRGQLLSNGQNFFEMMLKKVRVLHAPGMTFPFGMSFDNIEELSIMHEEQPCFTKNHYPALKKLIAPVSLFSYPLMGYNCPAFVNLEILKLSGREFTLDNKTIRALNDMPKLVELHCRAIEIIPSTEYAPITEQNQTVARLYTKNHFLYTVPAAGPQNFFIQFNVRRPQPAQPDPTVEEMDDYARQCKLHFVGLKRFEIERPKHLVEF